MRTLSDEQKLAVVRRQGSVLLAAGAGSGKTSVLVERFVAAVAQDGVTPGRILAITFTERAAGELRERVRARFLELGQREAARDTERAHISTVHGFCARVLRAHALAAGLDPGFSVLSEPRAARLRELAFRRALSEFVASGGEGSVDPAGAVAQRPGGAPVFTGDRDHGAPVDVVAAYGADRLRAAILTVHEELRSRGQLRPTLPALSTPATMPTPGSTEPSPRDVDSAPPGIATTAALARAVADAQRELGAAQAPGRRVQDALDVLQRAADRLTTLETLGGPGRSPPLAMLGDLTLPAPNGVLAGPGCETYRLALDALARRSADHHGARVCALLDELLRAYGLAYASLKQERLAVDFDDLELLARDLLERNPAVRASWAERLQLLMVDEFQDTNPRQLAILGALERDNLFTVGDEFQSIYGFRHADVSLFRDRRRALAQQGSHLVLSRNYRGRRPLLDVINAVFAARFGADFIPLSAGREDDEPAAEPLVELLLTDSRGWEAPEVPDVAGTLPPATRWRQAEARMLAQRVAELIEAGQARAGDTAVLVRATGDIPVFERALQERGLSTLAAGAGGYWSHQQVGDLLAYLAALVNPLDEQALYATLASPLVGLSADGLALVARATLQTGEAGGKEPSRGAAVWPLLVRAFGDGDGDGDEPRAPGSPLAGPSADEVGYADPALELAAWLSPPDRARLARFVVRLIGERAAAPRLEIAALLVRAVQDSGYEHYVLSLRWGARRLANVHKLLRLARLYEAAEGRDLRGFLEHAQRQAQAQAREADAPVQDEQLDAVRLMTIHAAKGLEFGLVAVADLGRRGRTDVPDLLVDGERVGLKLLALDGSAPVAALEFETLRAERLEKEAREEERVLYVAMTRARERLLLSGAVNPQAWPAERPGAPALSWLGCQVASDITAELTPEQPITELQPPGQPGARVLGWLNAPATIGRVLREESLRATPPTTGAGAPTPLPTAHSAPVAVRTPADPPTLSYTALAEFERCGYRYYLERVLGLAPDERGAPSPDESSAPRSESPPSQTSATGGLSGRLRGSLVHRLLESIDYGDPRPPVPAEVARVAGELGARPSERESAAVAELVSAVARTELGNRLASAARILREHPFAFSLGPGQPLISGVLDAIAHEFDGRCLIVDYKSDAVGEEDLQVLAERHYAIQRVVYALAALRTGALEVEVVHWFLERPREPVSARFSAADAPALSVVLQQRVTAVAEGRFVVTAQPHRDLCLTCPGRRSLCSYPEEVTLGRLAP